MNLAEIASALLHTIAHVGMATTDKPMVGMQCAQCWLGTACTETHLVRVRWAILDSETSTGAKHEVLDLPHAKGNA